MARIMLTQGVEAKKWGTERQEGQKQKQKQAQNAVKRSSGWSLLLAIAFFLPRSPRGNWHEPAERLIAGAAGAAGGGLDALAGGALKQSQSCGVQSLMLWRGRSPVHAASGMPRRNQGG